MAAEEPPTPVGEGSMIGRIVAIITPFFATGAGALAGWVAKELNVKLDKGEIVAFMVAVATAVLTSAWKWLEGLQRHEHAVAEGKATAIKTPTASKGPATSAGSS